MKLLQETRDAWPGLTAYQKFEQVIALVLSLLTATIIVVATLNLVKRVFNLVLTGVIDPTNPEVFQSVFGMIMIVLIALEFNHTLIAVVERHQSIIQVRIVVLIALLAILRKFIILELADTSAIKIFALSAAALALGGIYWVVREQDFRQAASRNRLED